MATAKGGTRHTAARKAAKRSTMNAASTKRSSTKKASTKRAATRTASKKTRTSHRKYNPSASAQVEEEMKEMKRGKLKSGRSGKKVTNPKQAIAIGLSEARKSGAKVPPNTHRKAA
ncbi:MAG TPA: DUF6496 domain-containing protein [Candidatus Saccharimonadales bacterium]|nr:DUF6496 domain-containing protein [Candidatus Saccharimonadales bacterium]